MGTPITPASTIERARTAREPAEVAAALEALSALEPEQQPERAALWLELLRADPSRPTLLADVERVLARWPEDPALVTRACDALIRAAELTPADEPPAAQGPAARAAAAAARCLTALERRGGEPAMLSYLRMGRANALRLAHAWDEALAAFEQALAAEPERGSFWFNLGLLHKARGDFRQGLACNQRARALLGDQKAVLWNSAICATALGEGALAVEALRKLGHDARCAESGMPEVEQLPPFLVRAATVGAGLGPGSAVPERSVSFELLWVSPLSPCHGVVASASYREASVDYGDVVLWDGAPVAFSERDGRPTPCFPLLAVLRRGDERRLRFVALQQQPGQLDALAADLPEGSRAFVHQERVEMLCSRCASGEHMHKHRHRPPEAHRVVYGKLVIDGGIALGEFRRELDARLRRHPGVQLVLPGLLEALGETAAAGKAHQLWRGLTRAGLKSQETG